MASEMYKNFVRAAACEESVKEVPSLVPRRYISGHDARRIYLGVVTTPSSAPSERLVGSTLTITRKPVKPKHNCLQTDRQVFLAAQNNNYDSLKAYISLNPEKINMIDEYGWSLLMIACQANSVQTVEELLRLGIDTSIRDKAGNSANSLLIKQKNVELINLMLNYKSIREDEQKTRNNLTSLEPYECPECKKIFRDRREHLSSTVHNINLSKDKRPRTWYGIPESNRGFQILMRSGWDRECGLGPEGVGEKYPIKPVVKQDRKGLGASNKKPVIESDVGKSENIKNKRKIERAYRLEKNIEKNFRREFL